MPASEGGERACHRGGASFGCFCLCLAHCPLFSSPREITERSRRVRAAIAALCAAACGWSDLLVFEDVGVDLRAAGVPDIGVEASCGVSCQAQRAFLCVIRRAGAPRPCAPVPQPRLRARDGHGR